MVVFVLVAAVIIFSNIFIPKVIKVTPGRVTLFNITQNPSKDASDILSSITIGYYYQEGTYTLLSSYIESLAKRKGIKLTFESSTVSVVVVRVAASKTTKKNTIPDKILEEASYVAFKIASEVALCSSPSSWNLISYSGEVSPGDKNIKYRKIGKGLFSAFVSYKNNKKISFLSMKLKVECLKNVLVLKRPIYYGQTIYPDDIELRKVDVLQIIGTPASTQDVYFSKAKRTLKIGEILTLDDVKRKPDVVKGEILVAYAALPGIYVTVMVESLQDAYIGDTIRVKNLTSGKILKGVLQKDMRVKVLEVER